MATGGKYCVLSLDGGGTWALIQAKALLNVYGDIPGRQLLAKFDLVAANSAGSIVAAALAANMSPSAILGKFLDPEWREKIFVELPWYQKLTRILGIGPRFSSEGKLRGLSEALQPISHLFLTDLPKEIAKG